MHITIYFPVHRVGAINTFPHYNLSPTLKIYHTNWLMRSSAVPAKKTTDLFSYFLFIYHLHCEPEINTRKWIWTNREAVSEAVASVYNRYGVSTAMRPHTTIRNLLIHPKDKVNTEETAECVYRIPCKNCQKVYIGETGEVLGFA